MDWLYTFWSKCDFKTPFKASLGNIKGPTQSFLLAETARSLTRPVFVVCADMKTANQLEEECQFLLNPYELPVVLFPDYETLPFDHFSAHQDIISSRLSALSKIPHLKQGLIITTMTALLQRLPPSHFIDTHLLKLKRAQTLHLNQLRTQFEKAGYRLVQEVLSHGEYAVRGSVIDVFPMGEQYPFRLDLFDHEIDSIRLFDPETQRSLQEVEEIHCLTAHELILNTETIEQFDRLWQAEWKNRYPDAVIRNTILEGRIPPGIEYYLPFFHSEMVSLLHYLPVNTLLFFTGDREASAQREWKNIQDCFHLNCHNPYHPALPPERVFIPAQELFSESKQWTQITLFEQALSQTSFLRQNAPYAPIPSLNIEAKEKSPYAKLSHFLSLEHPAIYIFTADSEGRCRILQEHLERTGRQVRPLKTLEEIQDLKPGLYTLVAPFIEGSLIREQNGLQTFLISELLLFTQISHHRHKKQRKTTFQDRQTFIRDITELQMGDPVVHIEHGVGRYIGLTSMTIGTHAEFVTLEYEQGDRLYVPICDLSCIARYSSHALENAPLDRLGSDRFSKAKEKAVKRIQDVAAKLLDIYAKREAKVGFAFKAPDQDLALFASSFPFELTEDQAKAIDEVLLDMQRPRPMDRLLCGDVGFGKTEVALRAAFLSVHSGKQVALLAPTTLLVEQHEATFLNRFSAWPVRVASISRFKSSSDLKKVIAALERGEIDIIIGTHKLLSDTVRFKNLGLVIIDEEHRFGVQHKERLKSLRAEVDILTMTATPIPRTLNMAFSDLRDLSIIATPPAKRLAVHTFVKEKSSELLIEAITREIHRGGQVYYLYNSVETIMACQRELTDLLPGLKVGIAHGQMRENELSPIMSQFYHNQFQVLICTTIIETGLDIPNANTIIIERADRLGLAQLHQLRGRVGRSHRQAYAYLLTPPFSALTRDAQKRLEAITTAQGLGAGFSLASFDLEIRGAGELLGDDQSGHMQTIGLSLYFELLARTVTAMKQERSTDLAHLLDRPHTQIELKIPSFLPESYVADIPTRLQFYHRLSRAQTEDELESVIAEIIDRFGLPPEHTVHLFEQTRLRLWGDVLGIQKIEYANQQIKIKWRAEPVINPVSLIHMVQAEPHLYQLQGQQALTLLKPPKESKAIFLSLFHILKRIQK